MAETFEIHCKVDKIYQVLLESLNPCIKDVIGTAKSYLKAAQHISTATQDYISSLERLSNVALSSNTAVESIGRCFKEIIQFLLHAEDRKSSMIAFISNNLLVPLEKNLDQDQKMLGENRKKYKKFHKAQLVELEDAQKQLQAIRRRIVSRRDKPNFKGIAEVLAEEEFEAAERVKRLRNLLDQHRIDGLKQALIEERKRCTFLLDCQIDIMTMYAGICTENSGLIQQSLDNWKNASKHPEVLPQEALKLLKELGVANASTDSHRKKLSTMTYQEADAIANLHPSTSSRDNSSDGSPIRNKIKLHWENSDLDQQLLMQQQQHAPKQEQQQQFRQQKYHKQQQNSVHRAQSTNAGGGGKRLSEEITRQSNGGDRKPNGGSHTQTLPRKVCSIAPFNVENDRDNLSDNLDSADEQSTSISAFYSTFYGAETPFTPNLCHRSLNASTAPTSTGLTNSLPITLRKDSLTNQSTLKPALSVQTQSQVAVTSGRLTQARHSYNPFHQRGQLEFLTGDLVQVIQDGTNGWKYGINLRTNKYGWFPSSYVKSMLERKTSGFRTTTENCAGKLPESLTTSFTMEADSNSTYVQRQHSQQNLTSQQISFKPALTRSGQCLHVERLVPANGSHSLSHDPPISRLHQSNQHLAMPHQPQRDRVEASPSHTVQSLGTIPWSTNGNNSSTIIRSPKPLNKLPSSAIPVIPKELMGASRERIAPKPKPTSNGNGSDQESVDRNPFGHIKLRQVKNDQGELRKYI